MAILTYGQDVRDAILSRLEAGETLRAICRTLDYPAAGTFLGWVKAEPELSERYARARRDGLDVLAEELLEIADDASNDTISTERGDVPNTEWINRAKLRVDTRKWLLSKLRPDVYGDKVQAELTGANGGPIQSTMTIEFVRPAAAVVGLVIEAAAEPDAEE